MFSSRLSRFFLAFLTAAALAVPAAAARRTDDPLSLVPADAASVAVVRLDALRSSPLSARLFANADRMTVDGDGGRFLEEAGLSLKQDVDTVIVAAVPGVGSDSSVLVLFQGRFDPARLAAAVESRGGLRRTTAAGDYELLPEKGHGGSGKPGAAAFVSRGLVIAGTESAVVEALAAREAGGTRFSSGTGLGKQLSRIDRSSAVWALVDTTRFAALRNRSGHAADGPSSAEPVAALASAMKSVSLFSVEATPRGDELSFAATGFAADAEARQLLEDSLRGLLAMWRLAVQEKSPDLVSALRRFQVGSDGEGVTVRGTIPAAVLRSFADKKSVQ